MYTGGYPDAPPHGLSPAVARVTQKCLWTRQRLVKAAGHVSLSPAGLCAGESSVFCTFHFGPLTFNFVFGPDFCYISFDLVRLGPPILIN